MSYHLAKQTNSSIAEGGSSAMAEASAKQHRSSLITHNSLHRFPSLLLLALSLSAGCSTPPARAPIADAVPMAASAPAAAPDTPGPEHGRLVPGVKLTLSIEVAGQFEFQDQEFTVGADGTTVLPLVDEVLLGGQTLKQAAATLTEAYQPFYVSRPRVMLQLADGQDAAIWGHVTVLGRVARPGRIVLAATREIGLSDAIGRAGGFATSAKTSGVKVTLHRSDGTVDQRTIDLDAVGRGNVEDVMLHSGDVVFVPERFF